MAISSTDLFIKLWRRANEDVSIKPTTEGMNLIDHIGSLEVEVVSTRSLALNEAVSGNYSLLVCWVYIGGEPCAVTTRRLAL